jgi:integrase
LYFSSHLYRSLSSGRIKNAFPWTCKNPSAWAMVYDHESQKVSNFQGCGAARAYRRAGVDAEKGGGRKSKRAQRRPTAEGELTMAKHAIQRKHRAGCPRVGTCECPWRLDYSPQGVRGPRRRLSFPTRKAAELHLSQTKVKVERGEYVAPERVPTFAIAAETWFNSKADRRPGHVANLRASLDRHLLPKLGTVRLDRVSVGAIENLRDDMRGDGYAPTTVNAVIQIVGGVFKAAIRRGECGINPVDRVERAFAAARELTNDNNDGGGDDMAVDPDSILNQQEVGVMLEATEPGLYRVLLHMAALTGARPGELSALRWGDVEMPKGKQAYVYIRRSVTWARVKGEEVRPRYFPPKTKAGRRHIPISAGLVTVLKAWKLECPPTDDELMFPAADGRPVRRSNVQRSGLWPALRRANLRKVTVYSLRHTFASGLIAGGAPVTEVQSLLGHSSPMITLKVYSHWFKGTDSGAVGRSSAMILDGEKTRHKHGTEADNTLRVSVPN